MTHQEAILLLLLSLSPEDKHKRNTDSRFEILLYYKLVAIPLLNKCWRNKLSYIHLKKKRGIGCRVTEKQRKGVPVAQKLDMWSQITHEEKKKG